MADKHILHMLSPLKQVSPFDANMALDAGFDAVLPYAGVTCEDVGPLVQDAIFSRPPKAGARTGVFIGGKDALLALDMLAAAKQAMVPPFQLSLFADPAGSFTTAAAMVARVQRLLRQRGKDLRGLHVVVFGATGVVGFASGVLAARQSAVVTLAGHDGPDRVARSAGEIKRRFNVEVGHADASSEERKAAVLQPADVAFCAGRAGVRILGANLLRSASRLIVAADVNAVPPSGVEGVEPMTDGDAISGTQIAGLGALAIGQTKYRTEFGLFRRMIEADKPITLDFQDAFALAQELAG